MKRRDNLVKRSQSMLTVGYYLSRCGEPTPNGKTGPPAALKAKTWAEAYDFFYEALGDGRTPAQFRNSLQKVRDAFDIVFDNGRAGWKDKDGNQPSLGAGLRSVQDQWDNQPSRRLENSVLGLQRRVLLDEVGEFMSPEARTEGGQRVVNLVRHERDPKLRKDALALHGHTCMSCGFNFEKFYGEIGKTFIEVHHVVPLADAGKRTTNPETDLIVLCANCHRMVHWRKGICLSLNEIRNHIDKQRSKIR